ncbi:SDR family oxidoreductase [Saccharothrix coeruleofusca]|uniref:Short-chain dehydrogenase n=1 Tax=Saccharothrix coeruleofusca TaxID=33919 RepID=A0A918AQV8_9PSEU|nr:SDR family oxidoreductase [Saccharothrix coeruleofusca]MBP2335282.1 NAD(P)-dependent dehydrogenase (short-subunit alcohol dehydrogenase family) [Saccharothrix coeruleofusca]GGP71957.1 short-chain dehydrogenase [Saccharothrix coeruleofusca]
MGQELGQVLVTGGASGLGAAVVSAVRARGGVPLVLDKAAPSSDEVADFESVDLSDTRAAERAVRAVAERNGGLRAVVTAAGIDACGPLDKVPATDWERVVMVNLFGTAAVVRAALPYLDGGRVVTIASTLGLRAVGDATAYCASKFGVVGFTRALAAETAGRVGVTLVIPGGMKTRFFDDRDEQYKPADDSKLNPPERVADAILFAIGQPAGCEVRELVVAHAEEGSWP